MPLADDIATSGASAIPSLFNPSGHSFLITKPHDELASLVSSSLNILAIIIESGFPEFRHELPPALHEYHQFQDHLYTVDGVILYKARAVISPSLRQHVLTILHLAHQGVTSMAATLQSVSITGNIN